MFTLTTIHFLRHYYCFITLFVFTLCACKKFNPYSDKGLPPATTTGQGVFACRVNGKPWISRKGTYDMNTYVATDTCRVFGYILDSLGQVERLQLELDGIFNKNISNYLLSDTSSSFAIYYKTGGPACFSDDYLPGYGKTILRKIPNGHLVFTRLDSRIISGHFDFVIPTDYCDSIHVTDGRFDIQY